jgi:hypothetical protein
MIRYLPIAITICLYLVLVVFKKYYKRAIKTRIFKPNVRQLWKDKLKDTLSTIYAGLFGMNFLSIIYLVIKQSRPQLVAIPLGMMVITVITSLISIFLLINYKKQFDRTIH